MAMMFEDEDEFNDYVNAHYDAAHHILKASKELKLLNPTMADKLKDLANQCDDIADSAELADLFPEDEDDSDETDDIPF